MVFPTFFNLSLNLTIRSSWSEPQSAPGPVFADFGVDHLVMSMCIFSRVVWRGCLLWPVCSLGKTLLAFALLHSVLQGHMWTMNFQMFKLVLEKTEEPEIKLPTSAGSSKKQESSRKTSISALLTMPKPLTMWMTINCGRFLKRWECQTIWPVSWETFMQVRKQQLELDMEQQTGFK